MSHKLINPILALLGWDFNILCYWVLTHQAHDLLIRQLSHFVFIARPGQLPVLKAFIEQPESLAVPIKCFKTISSTTAEEKDASRKGIKIEALLKIDPSTHVSLTVNTERATQFCQINHGSRTCPRPRA